MWTFLFTACSRCLFADKYHKAQSAEREETTSNEAESLFYTQDWLDKLQG